MELVDTNLSDLENTVIVGVRVRFAGWHSGLFVGQRVTAVDGDLHCDAIVDTYSQRHQIGWLTLSPKGVSTPTRGWVR